ncbi:MAG: rhamnulokinase [bacterium]
MPGYIAVDLGAESGRLVSGTIAGGNLRMREIARFPNGMIRLRGRLHWNLTGMFQEIKCALATLAESDPPESVGVDTWGVDFVLLAEDGSLAGLPAAYRDSRTDGMMDKFFERVPRKKIYQKTGIQFLPFNSLYQLFAMAEQKSPQLRIAKDLLFVPDYINYLLTGEKCSEFTIATTSQLYNVHEKNWDAELVEAVGVPMALLQKIVAPGTAVGRLSAEIQGETGLGDIKVIAPAAHDTGSAIAAVPAEGNDWAYISSGTWSLMGIEIREPVVSEEAEKFNFTNEGGVNGTYRFLKNIMGMWTVQRIRADFGGRFDYGELTKMAAEASVFKCLINVEDPCFLNPTSMTEAIAGFCEKTGQHAPQTPGEFARCAFESLALHYCLVIEELRQVQNAPINRIHVVGGGSRNALLCQMTADSTGLPVLAGPVEATAIGNIIVQAQALGHIGSLGEARAIVRRSFEMHEYEPAGSGAWADALGRYKAMSNR